MKILIQKLAHNRMKSKSLINQCSITADVLTPKSIISIRDEVSGIGISETSFTGGLMP